MSSSDIEDEIDPEVPAKRMKIDETNAPPRSAQELSQILQREIEAEINIRSTDLLNIEENIFLTKKCLLKLRQGVVSEYYKEKAQKDYLQYPPHPAVQDTFVGKAPRKSQNLEDSQPAELKNEVPELKDSSEKKKKGRKSSEDKKVESTPPKEFKPPCYIQPKPYNVETVKPSEPRGYTSKKQIRIIVGNVSKWLAPEETSHATHKWTVYTKSNDVDLSLFLSKVVFFLHPSYKPNDVIPILGPPFKLTRRGWGEFPLKTRFYFKNPLDNPVDVVHVLKLDNKHTGFETFGSETALTVWIHLPSDTENEESVPDGFLKSDVHSEEENKEVTIKETTSHCCRKKKKKKKKKDHERRSAKEVCIPAEVTEGNTCLTENSVQVETDINKLDVHIKEEPLSPQGEDNTEYVYYDGITGNIKSEDYSDNLDFIIKQEDKESELSQLSNAFIEEVIKAGIVPEEFASVSNAKPDTENNYVINNVGENQIINDGFNVHVKTEPCESGHKELHQEAEDDFLDECNVVESEVIICCDDEDVSTNEDTNQLEVEQSLVNQNEVTLGSEVSIKDETQTEYISKLDDALTSTPLISNSITPNFDLNINSKEESSIKIIELSSLLKENKNTSSTKAGISQNNSVQDIIHPSNINNVNSNIHITKNPNTQKIIINNVVCQPIQIKTSPEKCLKSVLLPKPEQLNSIEITENGKTIAAGMVPVLKVNDVSNTLSHVRTVPRKVFVRKLNGEVATILAPVSQDLLTKTLKLSSPQINVSDVTTKVVTSSPKSSVINKDILLNNCQIIKNLGNAFTINKITNPPLPLNNVIQQGIPCVLQQGNCVPSKTSTTQNTNPSPGVAKPKRKYNSNKQVKSTIIMLQKENGEVILKKEAKFCDFNDDVNSSGSFKKGPLEGTSSAGNRKGNGKKATGALQNISLLSFSKCQTNNTNPSLIKLQQPIGSNCSSPTSAAESLLGQRKVLNVNSKITPSDLKKVLNSSLLKKNIEKEATTKKNENKKVFKDLEASILLNCPTKRTEEAVSWLIKKIPLFDKRAEFPAFKSQFPFCAKSREEFLNWPYPKQRAAEYARSKLVLKYLKKLSLEDEWTAAQIYDWARLRAFTPMKIDDSIEAPPSSSSQEISFYYPHPSQEIRNCMKKCKDLREKEFVDVETLEKPSTSKKSDPSMPVAPKENELVVEEDGLFEPELEGLRQFMRVCLKNVGAVTSPELISPGISYSAAERLLISAFHSVAEDVIRRSYSASWVRHNNRPPTAIAREDVQKAVLSRKELDPLIPKKTVKRERPPVTILPNFS